MSHKKGIGAVPKFADLTLSDRADGVKGHYCVGFTDEQGTRWSWNKADGGHFGAYGTLIVGEEAALALLAALQKAHNFYTAGTNTIETYRESEARLNQLLTEASAETREAWCKLDKANAKIAELEAYRTSIVSALSVLKSVQENTPITSQGITS